MPESKVRKKPNYTPPPKKDAAKVTVNGPMFVPIMCGLLIVGLAWIVVAYLTSMQWPIPKIGTWNLGVGLGFLLGGLIMSTRWK